MNNRQQLERIKEKIEELEIFADSGGNTEMAFDLCADSDELQKINNILIDFGTRIRMELE